MELEELPLAEHISSFTGTGEQMKTIYLFVVTTIISYKMTSRTGHYAAGALQAGNQNGTILSQMTSLHMGSSSSETVEKYHIDETQTVIIKCGN